MPLHVSTHVLIIRRLKLHYTASGTITPIGGRLGLGCVAVGFMKVGSRVLMGDEGSAVKLTHLGLCTVLNVCLLVGLFDVVEPKLIGNGTVFAIQVRTNKQSIA